MPNEARFLGLTVSRLARCLRYGPDVGSAKRQDRVVS